MSFTENGKQKTENAKQTLCPIPGMGYCIYDRCPYWDAARQECDADCLQSRDPNPGQSFDDPCTIHWTEDND